ncbi:hypothetical protein [Thermopirellula anaerolimosa]
MLERRCELCGSLLDEEDLFCANCGREAPSGDANDGGDAAATREGPAAGTITTNNFTCSGCGASMSYDAGAKALRCPFCGSTRLEAKPDAKSVSPRRVIPFAVDRAAAESILRGRMKRGLWQPSDLADSATVTEMMPVYVPYWSFSARTHTYWTADSSVTPPGARGNWFPLFGEHRGRYDGLLIGAGGTLRIGESSEICPFDLSRAVPPEEVDLDHAIVERFSLPRRYARTLAVQSFHSGEASACAAAYVPGSARNVKVNVVLSGMSSEPILAPVWLLAYRYRDRVFRFVINGQTGKAVGSLPVSPAKIVGATVVGAIVLSAIVLLFVALVRGC